MKQFLKKFLTYCLVYIVVFGTLLSSIGWYLEKDRIYSKKRFLFETNKKDAVYIITGTSHTLWGVNPTMFPEKAINIAEKNKPIDIDLQVLMKNINNLTNTKYVIIPIDYFTFYFDGRKDNGAAKLYHHWGLKYPNGSWLKKYHITTCGIDVEELFPGKKKDKFFGYEAQKNDYSKVKTAERTANYSSRRELWEKYFIDTTLAENIYQEIQNTVKALQERHIKPVIVTMPMEQGYFNALDPLLHAKNEQLIRKLIDSTGAPYLNFQNKKEFEDLSMFKNQDHLNDKGATNLTKILVDFIRTL